MSSPEKSIRIVLADDHPLILQGLRRLLEPDPRYQIIAECDNGQKLLDVLQQRGADLVICDLSMPKLNGLDAIREIRKLYPKTKILILSMHKDPQIFEKALALGVDGYVLKEDIYDQLLFAIQTVVAGGKSYSPRITETFAADRTQRGELAAELLTRREREILRHAALGLTNREIADTLGISVRTVESHRANLMRKLDLESVQELVAFALKQGIVSVDEIES
ncbi:MAG: response regulator transcription factor [Turneriella sp.]|nr:response regulator transcription factor [Turneriella sp.]